MKNKANSLWLLAMIFLPTGAVMGQSGSSGSNILIYSLIAVAVLIFFYLLVQVADNLLAIEARQSGSQRKGVNYGIFPRISEIFAPKLPDFVEDSPVTVLKRGHNILLQGEAAARIDESVEAQTFAVQPFNFKGIAPIPKMLVEVGAEVKAGDPLFFDKANPEIHYVAPVSGEVIAINRGAKRAISEVVILADKTQKYRSLNAPDPASASREDLVKFLMDSGAWPLIKQRPFNLIADPAETPRDIFVSTFDSAPLAPDQNFVVQGREAAFRKGIDVLSKLTSGKVYLGLNAKSASVPSKAFTESNAEVRWFYGKHPAGNVGIQIHHIRPIGSKDKVWTLGVQEVITLGALFTENRFNAERIVALTGAELKDPVYVRTSIGANLGELLKDNLKAENTRMITGDVLSGRKSGPEGFLDFYDDQVTVVEEGDYYELFGWLLPIEPRPSISNSFPNFLFPNLKFKANTNSHGERRAFVVTGQYEEVLPMDVYPQALMKSILNGEFERMEGLGIYELVEEDVALCEFVCTSKQPLQQILRQGLEMMREQG